MNYSKFFTPVSLARGPSFIRDTTRLLVNASPELVFLGVGFPNPNLFPFQAATITLKNGQEVQIKPDVMNEALQYSQSLGYPPLVEKLKSLTYNLHKPPNWSNSDLIVTSGGQYGLAKAIEMFVGTGDYFITQEPIYSGTLSIVEPLKPKYIPIDTDEHGMNPDILLTKLENERKNRTTEIYPKVLYVNPTAGNPCGTSITFDRKKKIYEIACKHNVIILEDDPYYFVQFDDKPSPTFLSLDVEGRVLRFDSFSKVLSAGIRLGYCTGPKELIERICYHSQSCILHTSGMSQIMVNALLDEWGQEKFLQHTNEVRKFYLEQRNIMLAAANKHLKDLCKWHIPAGGMFLWIEVPEMKDTFDMITKRGIANNVFLIPGKAFLTDRTAQSNYMRASFSIATAEELDRGFTSLAKMIREEIIIQNKK